jgi:hypothetical protein
MAAMAQLAQAMGTARVFHTRMELQLKHKLRQFRTCNGVLDTSRIHGTQLLTLQQAKVATDNMFHIATNLVQPLATVALNRANTNRYSRPPTLSHYLHLPALPLLLPYLL